MVNIDMTKPTRELPAPGTYLCIVKKATQKKSNAGDQMFNVELYDSATDIKLCHDNISLEGRGWFHGRNKLLALGFSESFSGEIFSSDIEGRMVYASITHRAYDGKVTACVDGNDGSSGYWPSGAPPHDLAERQKAIIANDETAF